LFSVMHATISLVQVFSKSLEKWKFVNCTVAIYKLNTKNFPHTQETPASFTGVVPFGQEPVQMPHNLTAPFLLTFAFVRWKAHIRYTQLGLQNTMR
jgi:hypothetical protein